MAATQEENRRLKDLELELRGVQHLRNEDQDNATRLTGAITDMEGAMGRKTYELQQKDKSIR